MCGEADLPQPAEYAEHDGPGVGAAYVEQVVLAHREGVPAETHQTKWLHVHTCT